MHLSAGPEHLRICTLWLLAPGAPVRGGPAVAPRWRTWANIGLTFRLVTITVCFKRCRGTRARGMRLGPAVRGARQAVLLGPVHSTNWRCLRVWHMCERPALLTVTAVEVCAKCQLP